VTPTSDLLVRGVAPLRLAGESEIGFLAHPRYLPDLATSHAGALLVSEEVGGRLATDSRPRLIVRDPHRALAELLDLFHPEISEEAEIHPTAVLGRGVTLGSDVRIGPYAVVEAGTFIGEGSRIGAHSVIGRECRIGKRCILHPHVVLYPRATLGDRVILHSGVRVGVDGFGYVFEGGAHRKVPQIGECLIEDDVEIGANTTIDRGSIGATRIGQGAKIDNLVQLAHNSVIGPLTMLAAQVGVAGSTQLGKGVIVGGQAGFGGHLSVGDGARIAGQSGITGDVAQGETVMGFPARPRMEFLRMAAAQGKIEGILRTMREVERRLAELEEEGGNGRGSP